MRQLRFVTRTEDGEHLLVESVDGLDRYTLPLDDTLRAAAAERSRPRPAPLPTVSGVEPRADIGPREIQVRVRAGESPQEVADEHGMTLERVLRFAAPVVAERHRITDEARRSRARRTGAEGTEPRVVQFGEAVDERYTAYGIDAMTVTWDSRRRDDGEWIVIATWVGGESDHAAQWLFHRASRTVSPLDDAAGDLLSDRPIRPVAPPAPEPVSAPPLAAGVIAFPPFPDAHTGPMRRIEDVFDQEAAPEGPRNLPPYLPAAGLQFEEPPLPLAISEADGRPEAAAGGIGGLATLRTVGTLRPSGTMRREETEDDKAHRARVPSWDDILLGVRRKQD